MLFVALAFYWLNLWGAPGYQKLCPALMQHPWRIAQRVTYLFNRLSAQTGLLLHPKPTLSGLGYFDTG